MQDFRIHFELIIFIKCLFLLSHCPWGAGNASINRESRFSPTERHVLSVSSSWISAGWVSRFDRLHLFSPRFRCSWMPLSSGICPVILFTLMWPWLNRVRPLKTTPHLNCLLMRINEACVCGGVVPLLFWSSSKICCCRMECYSAVCLTGFCFFFFLFLAPVITLWLVAFTLCTALRSQEQQKRFSPCCLLSPPPPPLFPPPPSLWRRHAHVSHVMFYGGISAVVPLVDVQNIQQLLSLDPWVTPIKTSQSFTSALIINSSFYYTQNEDISNPGSETEQGGEERGSACPRGPRGPAGPPGIEVGCSTPQ